MEKLVRFIFSMRMMAVGMVIFLVAIAVATFLESTYDTQTARILIYSASWFEILLVFLGINLIANIFTYRMYKADKIAMLMFHLSFIIMLIGAGITRFISFEGMMMVREKENSNIIYSSDPYFWFIAEDGTTQTTPYDTKALMSEVTPGSNYFQVHVEDFPGHPTAIKIEYADFRKKLVDSLVVNDSIQESALEIVTDGMTSNFVGEGEFLMLGDMALSFSKDNAMPGIEIVKQGPKYLINTQYPMMYLPMAEMQKAARSGGVADSLFIEVPTDTLVPFQMATLYKVGDQQFVFKSAVDHAKRMLIPSGRRDVGSDYLTVKISDGDLVKYVDLEGGMGRIPEREMFEFNGLVYHMDYGSKQIEIPFHIYCKDFQLDKYPGSDSPSSFASEVAILKEEENSPNVFDTIRHQRIFMNNVMDYEGYRFFQSGYDPDEGGTRLSVNHDFWGTTLSYIGYLMMAIGMIMSMFAPTGRFRELYRFYKKSREKRKNTAAVLIGFMLMSSMAFGQDTTHQHHEGDGHNHSQPTAEAPQEDPIHYIISEEHADELASLLVQGNQNRFIPFHTLSDQLMRKMSRKRTFGDNNAVQTVISMHIYPGYWARQDLIYVSSKSSLREDLGVSEGRISFLDLTNDQNEFVLENEYRKSHQKLESNRDEYDKRLIKLRERYHVFQQIIFWEYMKIIPLENDLTNTWHSPFELETKGLETEVLGTIKNYINGLHQAAMSNKYGEVTDLLIDIKKMQRERGKDVVPDESYVEMEISYNKMNIFKNAQYTYLLLGFVLLIIFFIQIFIRPGERTEKVFKWIGRIFFGLVAVMFFYHGYGLYMRWLISGHAPWSDAYEAVIFIAWVAVLVGLLMSRKNMVILAGALILAFLMLFVTDMNLFDPEITALQPVLKSYWLMIHVAIITGSYAPLGLSCILGLINIFLYIFKNKKNAKIVSFNINELSYISEMSMTIGLFMLAIGTFLGGVWANESWGRYWGWDPKETWALVAVLVYAVILHLRYLPKLKSKFTFSIVSFWGYASILFTFFGVNFFLVGLHSYAQGEGLGEIPDWIYKIVVVFYLLSEIAYIQNKRMNGGIDLISMVKKVVYLIVGLIFLGLFGWLFHLASLGSIAETFGQIIGLIIVINALIFLYSYLRGNTKELASK